MGRVLHVTIPKLFLVVGNLLPRGIPGFLRVEMNPPTVGEVLFVLLLKLLASMKRPLKL